MGRISEPNPISSMASIYTISFILINFSNPFASVQTQTSPSAYEILQEYNFPTGLLPKGVTGYEVDGKTGEFAAYLNGTCKFTIESYELEYKNTITGLIGKDRIRILKGVSVKVFVVRLNIVQLVRDGDEIQFSVGISSANFEVDNFNESPQCGCGFDCNMSAANFVSSF